MLDRETLSPKIIILASHNMPRLAITQGQQFMDYISHLVMAAVGFLWLSKSPGKCSPYVSLCDPITVFKAE